MNYIKHLSGFFDKVSKDDRLNPTHISLYVSLFQFWNACRFHNPISISRNEVMKVSKICSKATYHKCIRELNDYGYLSYHPSYNPFKGSLVYLFNFRTGSEQVANGKHTKNETSTEQALVPYINNTNNNKQQTKSNESTRTPKANKNIVKNFEVQKKKVAQKKKASLMTIPQLTEVKEYFVSQKFPLLEADKFFNHFTSNGWLVSGKTPMRNWQAASNKWMLNSNKFNNNKKTSSNVSTGKNYSEAL
jgi:hypothetical protein